MPYGKKSYKKNRLSKDESKQVARIAQAVVSKNVEDKQVCAQVATAYLAAGQTLNGGGDYWCANAIGQGDFANQRAGNRYKLKGLQVRFSYRSNVNFARKLRCIIVIRKVNDNLGIPNTGAPFAASLVQQDILFAPGQPYESPLVAAAFAKPNSAYKLLLDEYYSMDVYTAMAVNGTTATAEFKTDFESRFRSYNFPLNMYVSCDENNGTSQDIVTNAIYVILIPDQATAIVGNITTSVLYEDA